MPKRFQEHIAYIAPGITLFAPTERAGNLKRGFGKGGSPLTDIVEGFTCTAAGELSIFDKYIAPACIRALYNIPGIPE